MQLNFEIVNTYAGGTLMDFTHEPDNLFTKYFKSGKHVLNESVKPYRGDFESIKVPDELDYTDLDFEEEPSRLTAQAITAFGVKNFPQFGSYGWYTTLYSGQTHLLVPINKIRSTYSHPQINVVQTGSSLAITITDPISIKYDCYRLMFRDGYFADEFITYEKTITVDTLVPGEYELTAIGYKDDGKYSVETQPIIIII